MTDPELHALLEELFPIQSHYFALTWVPLGTKRRLGRMLFSATGW